MDNTVVWKYDLGNVANLCTLTELKIPKGFQFLSVQRQYNNLCLWAEVNPDRLNVSVVIEIVGTGLPIISPKREFIGTVQIGEYVYHIYQVK